MKRLKSWKCHYLKQNFSFLIIALFLNGRSSRDVYCAYCAKSCARFCHNLCAKSNFVHNLWHVGVRGYTALSQSEAKIVVKLKYLELLRVVTELKA